MTIFQEDFIYKNGWWFRVGLCLPTPVLGKDLPEPGKLDRGPLLVTSGYQGKAFPSHHWISHFKMFIYIDR